MREMILGVIAVGLVAGVFLGRNTERARRSRKDLNTAKAAVPKAKETAMTELRRAVLTGVIIAALIVGVITLLFGSGS
ncbi:MAG TPA: hypothetical protein VH561_07050 [Micromonosporaceae bacterium]